jgi:hypothetical protein
LPVASSQVQGVPEQSAAMFGIERPDKRFIGHAFPLRGRSSARHIS